MASALLQMLGMKSLPPIGGQQAQAQATLLPASSLSQPTDAMNAAVAEAKRRYPRIANLPIALTYNPQRDRNSETFWPGKDENPVAGHWNIQMGRQPYAPAQESWPELVGLESLHALQETDPTYRQFTDRLIKSYTPEQTGRAQKAYQRDLARDPNWKINFQDYLRRVDAPELIRGRLWGDLFRRYEGGTRSTSAGYSPDQIRLIDDIQNYLRSSN